MSSSNPPRSLFRLGAPLQRILDAELAAGNALIERSDFLLPLQLDLRDSFHDVYARVWSMPGVTYHEERDIKACMWEDVYSHGAYSIAAPGIDEQTPQDLEARVRFTALTEAARADGRLLAEREWRGPALPPTERDAHLRLFATQIGDELEHELRRIGLWIESPPPAAGRTRGKPADAAGAAAMLQLDLIAPARAAAAGAGAYPRAERIDPTLYSVFAAAPNCERLCRMIYSLAYAFGPAAR